MIVVLLLGTNQMSSELFFCPSSIFRSYVFVSMYPYPCRKVFGIYSEDLGQRAISWLYYKLFDKMI